MSARQPTMMKRVGLLIKKCMGQPSNRVAWLTKKLTGVPRPNTTGSRQFETNHGKLASPEIGNTGLLVIIVMMIIVMMMMMIRKPAMLSHASAVSTTKTQSISGSLSWPASVRTSWSLDVGVCTRWTQSPMHPAPSWSGVRRSRQLRLCVMPMFDANNPIVQNLKQLVRGQTYTLLCKPSQP